MPAKRTGAPVTSLTLSAAARVAVELREDDAGEVQAIVEALRDLDRVLTDHRVDDEEDVLGLGLLLDVGELLHQLLVDRETAGGVVDDDVAAELPRLALRLRADVDRRRARDVEDRDVDALAEHLELLHRRRTLHVGSDEQRLLVLLLLEVARELRARRRLSGALEADHHDAGRPLVGEHDRRAVRGRHEVDELVVADLGELVAGGDVDGLAVLALRLDAHDLAERFLLHAREERLHDAELDIGLEEAEPHLSERGIDVLLCELRQSGKTVLRLPETFRDRVEHCGVGGGLTTDALGRKRAEVKRSSSPSAAALVSSGGDRRPMTSAAPDRQRRRARRRRASRQDRSVAANRRKPALIQVISDS